MPVSLTKRAGSSQPKREERQYAPRTAERPQKRKRRVSLVFLLLLGIVLYSSYGNIKQIWQLHQEKTQLLSEVAALKSQNQALAERVEAMEQDDWVEQAAREELGLVKPGEIVLIPQREP